MDIIQQLINIEKKAQNVIVDADELEKNFEKDIGESVKQLKKDFEAKVVERIESIGEFEKIDADKRIEAIRKSVDIEKAKLAQKEQDNHDAWVEKIFNDIIG